MVTTSFSSAYQKAMPSIFNLFWSQEIHWRKAHSSKQQWLLAVATHK